MTSPWRPIWRAAENKQVRVRVCGVCVRVSAVPRWGRGRGCARARVRGVGCVGVSERCEGRAMCGVGGAHGEGRYGESARARERGRERRAVCGAGESDAQCAARAGGPGSAAGRQCVGGRVRSYGESHSCEECVS